MTSPVDGDHIRTCPLCEAMCGLRVTVEGGRVARIRANPDDVWSRGFLCPKGTTLGELHHDPDRLRAPLEKDGAGWREVSWPEAFRTIGERLRPILDEHGPAAVSAYIG
jgi:anaerobic selenocysteine-containing dehydrogenase